MDPILCEHCGSAVSPADLTSGHCPLCMVELGFEPSSTSTDFGADHQTESTTGAAVIDGYTILRLIGEGGMGAVYEAEQHHPRRFVAVKIIKAGRASADSLRRFEQEAHALGRLQHPNIARIYESGTADTGFGPQPYFAMEFARGRSPQDYANAHQLKLGERLELVAKIADGVHHAHQHGLIHRDLKPANILVDEDGQPRILDFGVARISDSTEPGQTATGQLVGTLAYMSPEQVSGDPLEIDIRTDIYALGVILYELLAGRRPYDIGRTLHEAIRTIRETEPAPLGAIDRAWRGDVETIAAKALDKDKSRRYGSAAELAADIRRYLKYEPIVARPASTTYQLQKFARRHRAIVIGVAATILALVAGVIASSLQTARAQRAEHDAVVERDRARDAEQRATLERNRATIAEASATAQRDLAQRVEELALADRNRALSAEDRARFDRDTLLWQTLARESIRYSDNRTDDDRAALLARQALLVHARTPSLPAPAVEDALQRAARPGPWGHTLFRGREAVLSVAISRDDYLACACGDSTIRIWDLRQPVAAPLQLAGHKNGVEAIAFSDDGRRVASGDRSGVVLVWDLRDPKAAPVRFSHPGNPIHGVAFSPDASRLAASNGGPAVNVWDLRNPAGAPIVLVHQDSVQSLAFSPDGNRLAASGAGLYLWNLSTPAAPSSRLRGVQTLVSGVAFSPDGAHVAAAENSGVHVWDVSNLAAPSVALSDQKSGAIATVAFSADGSQLAAGGFRTLTVWDPRKPAAPSLRLDGYEGQVMAASFSRDGRYLATGASDKTLRLWDLQQDEAPMVLSPGPIASMARNTPTLTGASFSGLAFSPDGTQLAAGSDDPNVRVWNLNQIDAAPLVLRGHEDAILSVAFSADGSRLASSGSTTAPVSQWGLYSLEGKRLASGGDGTLRVWNLRTPGVPPLKFAGHRDAVLALFFSAQSRLSSASADGTVRSWDAADPRASTVVLDERSKALAAAVEPYRRRLLRLTEAMAPDDDQFVLLVKAIDKIAKGQSSVFMAAFSPDGKQLATVGTDRRTVRLWDLTGGGALPRFIETRSGYIAAVAWAPDSRHLAIGGVNPNVQIWDTANLASPPISQGQENAVVSAVAFSPDSTRLAYPAGAVRERGVNIWDWREPVKPPTRLPGAPPPGLDSLAFSPDGRQLAALHRSTGRVALWRLTSGMADYICTRVWRNLTAEEWGSYVGLNAQYESTCAAVSGIRALNQINVGRTRSNSPPLPVQPLGTAAPAASGLSRDGSGCTFSGVGIEGTRLTISAPLSTLMSMAYGSRDYDCRVPGVIVGGPDWIMSEQHEVHVTVPDGQPANAVSSLLNRSAPAIQAALKTVLEDRFKLRVRIETRDVDAYALTSIGTLALTPVTAPQPGIRSGRTLTRRLDALGRPYGDFYGGSVSMADLTIWFKGIVGAPVDDRTSLTGRYDVELEFDQTGVARPTLSAALQRIGLDLKPAKLPMQVLIVDRAERPTGR